MIKSFEEAQNWGKQGFEAYVASATAWTKGLQGIATEVADYSRKSFEEGTAMVEKAVAAKSFDKALEVQQGYVKSASEAYVGEMTKLGEMYKEAAQEAYKPFEASISKMQGSKPAAASK
ncbi:MAG: phasin family protein [Pseudomonadota bacterium]